MSPSKRLILGVPTGGNIRPGYFDSCIRDRGNGIILDHITGWSIYLENNRNNICEGFLTHFPNEELLLQADDDLYWDPDVLPRLVDATEKHEVVFPHVPLGIGPTNALKWNGAEFDLWWPHGDRPFLADGVAGAMFIVRRDLLEMMPRGEWFARRRINGKLAGEDASFSYRIREMGIKPFCIPGLKLIHWRITPIISEFLKGAK